MTSRFNISPQRSCIHGGKPMGFVLFLLLCTSTASVASCPGNEFSRQIFYDSWWGHPVSWFDELAMIFRSPMDSAACRWPYGMQCVVWFSEERPETHESECHVWTGDAFDWQKKFYTFKNTRGSPEFKTSASHLACIPLLVSCPLLAVYKLFNRTYFAIAGLPSGFAC